jgi:hypothetical protein
MGKRQQLLIILALVALVACLSAAGDWIRRLIEPRSPRSAEQDFAHMLIVPLVMWGVLVSVFVFVRTTVKLINRHDDPRRTKQPAVDP